MKLFKTHHFQINNNINWIFLLFPTARVDNGRRQTVCKRIKIIGDTDTNNKNIQSGYRNGIWHNKCAILIIRRKRQIKEGIEQANVERIKMHWEKENYKYTGTSETDTIT